MATYAMPPSANGRRMGAWLFDIVIRPAAPAALAGAVETLITMVAVDVAVPADVSLFPP